MQGFRPSLNTTIDANPQLPSPSSYQQTQQTNLTMNDLAARIEQQKLLLRRAQLQAAAEQPPAFSYSVSGSSNISANGGNNGGLDAILRHKALLNSAQPMANANLGLPPTALDAIDAKTGIYGHLGGGRGQGQGLLQYQNNTLAANQTALARLSALRRADFNLPAPSPSSAGLSMFRTDQVAVIPSAVPSSGNAADGDALLARQVALRQLQQQSSRQQQPNAAATTVSNNSPLVVPPSLAHLQPQPFKKKNKTVKRGKKPADKPKRPLSAYNLFFRDERGRILESIPTPAGYGGKKKNSKKTETEQQQQDGAVINNNKRREAPHGKIGFENLAKIIARRWKDLSEEEAAPYKARAEKEMAAYRKKMDEWIAKREAKKSGKKNSDEEESSGSKKRRSLEEQADEILFASVRKKVRQLDGMVGVASPSGVPRSAPAPCF